MKYFVRILAFLFIGFSSLYGYTLEKARESANQSIASAIAFEKKGVLFSNLGCSSKGCFIKIDNTVYSVPSQPDICIGTSGNYGCYSNKTELTYYVEWNGCLYKPCYFSWSSPSSNPCEDSGSSYCEIIGTAPYYNSSSFKASPVCSLDENNNFSVKHGTCVPKCVNPENGEQGYYNYDKGRCEFCSFGATFDEKTETCSNWKCFQLENKMERFDCMCREGGHGAGVNSQILVTGAGTDCSITCEDGLRISTISNFNVFKQLFDTVFNGGYVQTTFSNPTKFCTVDNSINIDLVDPSDSEAEQAGSQSGKQSSEQSSEQAGSKSTEQSGKQGGEQGGSQTAEQGGEQGGEQGSSKSVEQNSKQSSEQAGSQSGKQSSEQSSKQSSEQAGSQDGEQAGVSKGTITIKDPVTGEEEVVEIGKNKKENSISYRDPETGNQVEIKPKDETGGNIITITDTITGETKTVEIGKNDNRKNEISYKDPYTGKDVIIELSPKDTDKTDNSQAESGKADNSQAESGKADNSQAEGDKKNNDDFEFKGPNLGALGNANDFDTGGVLSGLNDELDSLSDDNLGFLESIIDNITSYIDDLKGSLDNVAQKASALSDNPFSSSNVTSCAIDFSLLDKSIKIDLCQYISQFKNLFYAIFYLALNVFIAFGMFRLFVLILVSI